MGSSKSDLHTQLSEDRKASIHKRLNWGTEPSSSVDYQGLQGKSKVVEKRTCKVRKEEKRVAAEVSSNSSLKETTFHTGQGQKQQGKIAAKGDIPIAVKYCDKFTKKTEKSLSAEALYKKIRCLFVMVQSTTGKWAREPLEVDASPVFL